MKTQDLISVVSIAVVGTLIAYFAMNAILGDPLDKTVSFDYLEFDADQFYLPDPELFNPAAINPTVDVYVGTCNDLNHNGLLEDFEKVECGQAVATQENEVTTSESETGEEASNTSGDNSQQGSGTQEGNGTQGEANTNTNTN